MHKCNFVETRDAICAISSHAAQTTTSDFNQFASQISDFITNEKMPSYV